MSDCFFSSLWGNTVFTHFRIHNTNTHGEGNHHIPGFYNSRCVVECESREAKNCSTESDVISSAAASISWNSSCQHQGSQGETPELFVLIADCTSYPKVMLDDYIKIFSEIRAPVKHAPIPPT